MKSRRGFTLIELSMVLVIIGLLAGGIFVGRDLIQAAEIRATVSQLNQFNTAVHTFELKFNALPGDILPSNAAAFGFTVSQCGVCTFNDGLIDYGKPYLFWQHLSQAQLIPGLSGLASNGVTLDLNGLPTGQILLASDVQQFLPPAKLGRSIIFNAGGPSVTWPAGNDFQLIGFQSLGTANDFPASIQLTSGEAYAIDSKMDDGMPNTGAVQGFGIGGAMYWNSTSIAGNCTYGGSAVNDPLALYNTLTSADIPDCSSLIRFQ